MSATEIFILLIVGVVVVGPKKLPTMMRTAGQWISRLRKLSTNLRSQSGIDRILREEGLENELRELRMLRESLSKQAIMDTLVKAAEEANIQPRPKPAAAKLDAGGRQGAAGEGGATALPKAGAGVPVAPASPDAAKGDDTPGAAATPDATGGDAAAGEKPEDGAVDAPASGGAAAPLVASDGSELASPAAAALIRPAFGSVSRGAPAPARPARPVNSEPYRAFRLREYPSFGVDHYEAFPDDIEEEDELAAATAAASASSGPAEAPNAAEPNA